MSPDNACTFLVQCSIGHNTHGGSHSVIANNDYEVDIQMVDR